MLDVPKFFWDTEPTLHPLYSAVREYLEIKQRILVLNERCQVFLDLASALSDTIRDRKMSSKYRGQVNVWCYNMLTAIPRTHLDHYHSDLRLPLRDDIRSLASIHPADEEAELRTSGFLPGNRGLVEIDTWSIG